MQCRVFRAHGQWASTWISRSRLADATCIVLLNVSNGTSLQKYFLNKTPNILLGLTSLIFKRTSITRNPQFAHYISWHSNIELNFFMWINDGDLTEISSFAAGIVLPLNFFFVYSLLVINKVLSICNRYLLRNRREFKVYAKFSFSKW